MSSGFANTAMRTVTGLFAVGAVLSMVSLPAAADDAVPGSMTAEGLLLQRSDVDGTAFTGFDDPGDAFTPFDAGDLDPDVSGGVRASLDVLLFGNRVQMSALVAMPFEDNRTAFDINENGTNAVYDDDAQFNPGADVNTANSDDLFALTVRHRTLLVGTDTAVVSPVGGVNFLWGTRFIKVRESLKSTAFDEENDFNGTDNDIDRVSINSDNTMYGAQIGIGGSVPLGASLVLSGHLKGGLMANFIDVDQSFTSDDNAANFVIKNDGDVSFAQFIEFNPRLTMNLVPNVDLTLGGFLLYVNGISEATQYFSTVTDRDVRGVDSDGDILFYGGSAGLTFRFN